MAEELGWMISKLPFQPKLFWDKIVVAEQKEKLKGSWFHMSILMLRNLRNWTKKFSLGTSCSSGIWHLSWHYFKPRTSSLAVENCWELWQCCLSQGLTSFLIQRDYMDLQYRQYSLYPGIFRCLGHIGISAAFKNTFLFEAAWRKSRCVTEFSSFCASIKWSRARQANYSPHTSNRSH